MTEDIDHREHLNELLLGTVKNIHSIDDRCRVEVLRGHLDRQGAFEIGFAVKFPRCVEFHIAVPISITAKAITIVLETEVSDSVGVCLNADAS